MANSDSEEAGSSSASNSLGAPLVFISHDSRDAALAEAFSKLLKSVSAGMIKTFRSSDKKGTEGIDFGDEWYKRLMHALQSTSDVVCLFTERSLERPWILFEAGVAKGKLDKPVLGVALGVPLARITTGPFYQFMNMDDSPEDLTKLVHQLARRVPGLELDPDVVSVQVATFKATEAEILKTFGSAKSGKENAEETQVAKLVEEMKSLPSRIAERLAEANEPLRRRRRRLHPMMFEELLHVSGNAGDPLAILMAGSLVREDAPWLYELASEAYRAAKSGDATAIKAELKRVEGFAEMGLRGSLLEDFMGGSKESHMLIIEFPHMIRHFLTRALEQERVPQAKTQVSKRRKSSPGSRVNDREHG